MCITEFGKKFGMEPHIAFNYLKEYKGIDFLNRYYEAEHQLSLNDAINDLISICKKIFYIVKPSRISYRLFCCYIFTQM